MLELLIETRWPLRTLGFSIILLNNSNIPRNGPVKGGARKVPGRSVEAGLGLQQAEPLLGSVFLLARYVNAFTIPLTPPPPADM